MIFVKVHNNNVEKALSKFKKKVKESKLMLTLKEKSFYTKPSAKRRAKRAMAKARYRTNSHK